MIKAVYIQREDGDWDFVFAFQLYISALDNMDLYWPVIYDKLETSGEVLREMQYDDIKDVVDVLTKEDEK